MSNLIGVIVDGPGDYASIKARFSGRVRVIKTDGPRGHAVSVRQLVTGSKRQISLLKATGCSTIILMVDFEGRTAAYETFVEAVEEEIARQAIPCNVQVCAPNRMIENWYLSDLEEISAKKSFIKKNLRQKPFEGCDGKRELKRHFKKGTSYNEVIHGPQLFATIRLEVGASNSNSLKCFLDKINGP